MPALNQVFANRLLDAANDSTGAAVRVTTAPLRLRQMTANGTATAAGTELATSGGYTAGTGAPTITYGAAAAGACSNNAAVTITNMPATTIVGVEEFDSAATPERKFIGALTTAKTTNAGDTLSYSIGAISKSLG